MKSSTTLYFCKSCFMFLFSCLTVSFLLYRRAISSSSVDGLCAMLNHASTVLEQDFREVLFSRVRAGFPSGFDLSQAYNMVQSSIQQGKLQSADQEKAKTTFLVKAINFIIVQILYCWKFWFSDNFVWMPCEEILPHFKFTCRGFL